MHCTPAECPHCAEWGPSVPGKVRCEKPPLPERGPGMEYHTFRFSTTLGAKCQCEDDPQLSLFTEEAS